MKKNSFILICFFFFTKKTDVIFLGKQKQTIQPSHKVLDIFPCIGTELFHRREYYIPWAFSQPVN